VEGNLYLVNGDIVDRGPASLQCILLLLAWQAASPSTVFINRGNHEAEVVNLKFGFYKELMDKYGDYVLFDLFQEVFSWLPAASLVSSRVLVTHGGLSAIPDLCLDDIRALPRGRGLQPEDSPLLSDLLWSDPMPVGLGTRDSSRGLGIVFGQDVTAEFLERNHLQCLVRSHEEISQGCATSHPGCYTVFSAPNRAKGVLGGVLTLERGDGENLQIRSSVFTQGEAEDVNELQKTMNS